MRHPGCYSYLLHRLSTAPDAHLLPTPETEVKQLSEMGANCPPMPGLEPMPNQGRGCADGDAVRYAYAIFLAHPKIKLIL